MNQSDKLILWVIAVVAGLFLPISVLMFGAAVGDKLNFKDALFSIVAASIISSPIWIALVVPSKYKGISRFFRWVGVLSLVLAACLYFISDIPSKAVHLLLAGNLNDFLFHIPFIVVVLLCLYGSWLLMKPDFFKSTQ